MSKAAPDMIAILITLAIFIALIHFSPTIGPKPAWTAGVVLIVLVILAILGKL